MKSTMYNGFLLAGLFIVLPAMLSAQCPQIVWSDEFEGNSLETDKWSVQTGDGCDIDLCGWGNNELQWYQAQNAEVSDGTLKIIAKRENAGGKAYTSARIRSINKADFTYGRFEARIKLPTGRGIWPAFWMLPTDEVYGGWPQSGEIDIVELIGSEPATVHGTVHHGNPWPNNRSTGASYQLHTGLFNDEFHEFAIEWEPGVIRWYVDGYFYASVTSTQVSPWPFDQDFHFLLNVAVGGNWPGNPDGSTTFPQVMEVDYVRVYDQPLPQIGGERLVANRAEGVSYQVNNAPESATFTWSVPEGATIVDGQGTESITVDWGETGGVLTVQVDSDCSSRELNLDVLVEPAFVPVRTLENFDDPGLIDFTFATGELTDEVANPAKEGINESDLSGRYQRNSSEQYDVLVYQTDAIDNADAFVDRENRFFIDLYTDAPPGTLVLLQLENSSRAQGDNYPTGRHSRYEVRTTKQNEWERLEFEFLDQPDAGASSTGVDQLILLFASNTYSGNTYYFDNLEIYGQETTTGILPVTETPLQVVLYPNPAGKMLWVRNEGTEELEDFVLTDISGRPLRSFSKKLSGGNAIQLDLENIGSGIYLLSGKTSSGERRYARFVKK